MNLAVKFQESIQQFTAVNLQENAQQFTANMGEIQTVAEYVGGQVYTAGDNIHISNEGVISVLTADIVESDNTKPVTSAAVAMQVGNIEILLQTI